MGHWLDVCLVESIFGIKKTCACVVGCLVGEADNEGSKKILEEL